MALHPKLNTFLIAIFVALGSILFGYDLGVIAAVLPSADFQRVMGPRIQDPDQVGLVTSLLLLGAFFSVFLAGQLADRYGRRFAILVGCIIFMLGGSLQTAAMNIETMMAGRFFAGAGVGFLSMLAPLYQSEIAQPSIRGRLTTLQQLFLGIGALVASWVGFACYSNYDNGLSWRLPLGLQLMPAVPLASLIYLFPESPRWLAMVGRDEDALISLARLHAHGNVDDPLVAFELEDIKVQIRESTSTNNPYKELFTQMRHFRPLLLGIILQFSVQMTGVSALQYYSPQIFANFGFNASTTLKFQSYNSIIAIVGELACIFLVDKLGRRWPLIVGNLMSCATYCCTTAIYAVFPASSNNDAAHRAFVAMTWIYNFFFSSCIGPLSWAYPVEILPTHLRAQGTAITSSAAWISNFMIAQVTPKAFEQIGWRYYLVFCILSFTNAVTVWALFPETKGRRLEEMEYIFKTTSWFVPSHGPMALDADVAEREMREGKIRAGEVAEHAHHGSSETSKHSDEKLERV